MFCEDPPGSAINGVAHNLVIQATGTYADAGILRQASLECTIKDQNSSTDKLTARLEEKFLQIALDENGFLKLMDWEEWGRIWRLEETVQIGEIDQEGQLRCQGHIQPVSTPRLLD